MDIDFTPAPMMKRAWKAELKILREIDRVCKKHGLTYFADYGTLIGAVRHNGFIPWDDDMDISMLRPDYMKLLSLLPKELPGHYIIHSYFVRPDHKQPFMTILNRETVGSRDDEITKEFYDCPFIVGVEIYPLDYVPRETDLKEMHEALYTLVYDCGYNYSVYEADGSLKERVQGIEKYTKVKLGNAGIPLSQEIRQLSDKIAMMFTEEESDHVITMHDYAIHESPILRKKEWYSDAAYVDFEDFKIPVPVGYDEYMTIKYGDYMKGVRYENHEYPFYKKQYAGLSEDYYNELMENGEL